MCGFRRASGYCSCNNCASYFLCSSRLYYSTAGTNNCWNNNIDCYSGRGSMDICKIPFTLAWNFLLWQYASWLAIDLIDNGYALDLTSPSTIQNTSSALSLIFHPLSLYGILDRNLHWGTDDNWTVGG